MTVIFVSYLEVIVPRLTPQSRFCANFLVGAMVCYALIDEVSTFVAKL